jgi:hypothetical protein
MHMPNERTEKSRGDRAQQRPADLKSPLPPANRITPPLNIEGPEAVRDSHC